MITFAVCTSEGQVLDTVNGETLCVCAETHYQTSDTDSDLVCEACPTGSTTGSTNSQNIDACCKYDKIVIPITRY